MIAGRRWQALAQLPGTVLPLLPTATCPACLGAYAGLVSALGIGFLFKADVLFPLIVAFLALGIGGAALSLRKHRHLAPFIAMLAGSSAVVAGRLVWNIPIILYGGVILLAFSSLSNVWLNRGRQQLIQLTPTASFPNRGGNSV